MIAHVHDVLRRRLLSRIAPVRPSDETKAAIKRDIAEKIRNLRYVLWLAINRITIGTFRYGVSSHDKYDYRKRLSQKLKQYDETGNKEFLIDTINYCMLEFFWPRRTDTYFKAVDDDPKSNRGEDK